MSDGSTVSISSKVTPERCIEALILIPRIDLTGINRISTVKMPLSILFGGLLPDGSASGSLTILYLVIPSCFVELMWSMVQIRNQQLVHEQLA